MSNGAKCRAFFKFKNPLRGSSEEAGASFVRLLFTVGAGACQPSGMQACIAWAVAAINASAAPSGIYGSQSREDYSADDVEHYFNYMGMLAIEVHWRVPLPVKMPVSVVYRCSTSEGFVLGIHAGHL